MDHFEDFLKCEQFAKIKEFKTDFLNLICKSPSAKFQQIKEESGRKFIGDKKMATTLTIKIYSLAVHCKGMYHLLTDVHGEASISLSKDLKMRMSKECEVKKPEKCSQLNINVGDPTQVIDSLNIDDIHITGADWTSYFMTPLLKSKVIDALQSRASQVTKVLTDSLKALYWDKSRFEC